ncbi:MAG: hypothetical protein K8W52_04480 [Deltaproteobacteria bacterium]|nr:hypothetical protein [Deltaproteobacteria bacterium]
MPLLVIVYAGNASITVEKGPFWVIVLGCFFYAMSSTNKAARLTQLEHENAWLRGQLGMPATTAPATTAPATTAPASNPPG